jgi:hypothetical protein
LIDSDPASCPPGRLVPHRLPARLETIRPGAVISLGTIVVALPRARQNRCVIVSIGQPCQLSRLAPIRFRPGIREGHNLLPVVILGPDPRIGRSMHSAKMSCLAPREMPGSRPNMPNLVISAARNLKLTHMRLT